jgi:hypothetical protein
MGRAPDDVPPEVVGYLLDGRLRDVQLEAPWRTWFWDSWLAHEDGTARVRAVWERVGPRLLEAFIAGHPGSRPHGWWTFDAPGPRFKLGGSGRTECGYAPVAFGIKDLERGTVDPHDPPVLESEAAYLKRHGLFLPGEAKRVPRSAFRPVVGVPPRWSEVL